MKKRLLHVFSNQHGSVINVALLILILIFLIGIGLSKMSTTDIKIANNIKQDTATFYEADASLEAAAELIEQNLGCITGFSDTGSDGFEIIGGQFYVNNLRFGHNERKRGVRPFADNTATYGEEYPVEFPSGDELENELIADFYFPPNYGEDTDPHTTISMGGASRFSKGSAIQMAAGYEGLGKGAGAGGGSIIYDVYAERIGINNTSSTHFMQWVHLIKPSTGCNF
jgi:hypothetical protein